MASTPTSALLLLLCLFLSVAATRAAQSDGEGPVTASLADPSVEAGETTQFRLNVEDRQADTPPPAPVVDGLSFAYVGASQQFSINIVNGQMVRHATVSYTYVVRTSRAGRFTIPAQTVQVGGAAQRSQPVTLTVEEAGTPGATPPGQTVSAELVIQKKTAYVGETFPAELRVDFGLNVNVLAYDEAPQLAGDGFSLQRFTQPRAGVQAVNGVRYRTATYHTAITGVKTGTLSIGPLDTTPTVQVAQKASRRQRQRQRGGGGFGGMGGIFGDDDDDGSPFNNPFGGSMFQRLQPPQQVKVTAPAVTVEILPLPAGKPEGFSGGIGQFKLEAEATPRRAQAGDPVTVRLILTGEGNFSRVNAPVLTDEHGLRTYPATAQFKADDDVGLHGTKTFEQVVISEGARDALPAFRFDYLDPDTGKYEVLDTGTIAVKIEGSAAPATPAVSTAPPASADTPPPTPTPTPRTAQDILYIRNDFGTTRDRTAFLPLWQRPVFWWAQAVPLAALLAVAGALAARSRGRNENLRRQAALQRQQSELGRVLRQETTSRRDFYTAAARLAQLQAAGRNGDDRLSAAEIVRTRGLDPKTASSVEEIFHRHDELAYSGEATAREPVPVDERRNVLATLETLGRNAR